MLLYVICHDDASERQTRDMCARYSSSTVRAVPLRVDLPSPAQMEEVATHDLSLMMGDHGKKDDHGGGSGSNDGSATADPGPLLQLRPFLYESATFLDVWARRHADAWESEDYVGLVTYSFEHKLAERYAHTFPSDGRRNRPWTAADWARLARDASARALDVTGLVEVRFYREFATEAPAVSPDDDEQGELLSMARAAELNHTRAFTAAWRALLRALGRTASLDDWTEKDRRGVRFHVSNWWVARPAAMRDYIRECFLPATRALLRPSDSGLDALFCVDSGYRTPLRSAEDLRRQFALPYFTLHPFVFERLPWQYFRERGARVGRPRGALPHFQCVVDHDVNKTDENAQFL